MFARIVSTVAVVLIFGGYSDSKEEAAGGGPLPVRRRGQVGAAVLRWRRQGRAPVWRFQAMLIEGRNAIKIAPSVSEAP